MPTTNYFIGPEDGWTQVSDSASFVRASSYPHTHPFYVYSGAAAPTDGTQGVLVCHHPFWVNVLNGDKVFVRVVNPVSSSNNPNGKLRVDVFTVAAGIASSTSVTLVGTTGIKSYIYDPATGNPVSYTGPAQTYRSDSFVNLTTATTTQVKSGAGTLSKLIINTPVASATIKGYDATSGTTNPIFSITLESTITGVNPVVLDYDLAFGVGLRIVTSGATDLTVVYR